MQVRIAMLKAVSVGGQRAHDLRIGPQPDYVDPARFNQNRVLIEPLTGTKLRAICEQRRAQRETQRAMKSSASVGIAGIITFGHEAQKIFEKLTPKQQDAAYLETAEAVAARLKTTLTGLVPHGDESAPHAHFQMPAFDLTGHPVSETAKRGMLRDLQTITAQVMARHAPGIERGRSKIDRLRAGADPVDVVNKSVKELHDALPAEIAAKRAEADVAGAALVDAQARVDEMQARVEKLQAKERDLTAAEAKRLATYEKRLADRLAEVAAAESAVEIARAEADRLSAVAADADQAATAARAAQEEAERATKEAEKDRESAEAMARSIRDKAAAAARSEVQRAEADAAAIREKAASQADAAAAAFRALAVQIRDGTVSQDENGKIVSKNSDALRPGGPPLVAAARAVLPLLSEAQAIKDAAQKILEAATEDRAAAAQERQAAAEDRATIAVELAEVRHERRSLAATRERIERALKAVLSWGPRVRRVIHDAEATAQHREAARDVRRDMVRSVPSLRRDMTRTQSVMDTLRRQSPAPEDPVPYTDRDDSGPGFG